MSTEPGVPPSGGDDVRALADPALEFARSLGAMLAAEAELSVAASLRAAALGALAVVALALAWLALAAALAVGLAAVVGAAPACLVVAALHAALAGAALWRRRVWQQRIGFGRTRRALHTALEAPERAP